MNYIAVSLDLKFFLGWCRLHSLLQGLKKSAARTSRFSFSLADGLEPKQNRLPGTKTIVNYKLPWVSNI